MWGLNKIVSVGKRMKFSILDGKTEFTILDGIWTINGMMCSKFNINV